MQDFWFLAVNMNSHIIIKNKNSVLSVIKTSKIL